MARDDTPDQEPTRRDYVKYSATVAGGGLLAGCAGDSTAPEEPTTESESESTESDGESTADTSYSVTMEPAGEVTFESVPERWLPYSEGYADMGVALGQADGMLGIGQIGEYYTYFYDELSGVSVDRERIGENELVANEMSKELFYELDSDVHFIDTGMLKNWFDWSQDDVDEISENVAPFVGNLGYRRSDDWHDYRYYSMYEAFEIVAETFQQQERYAAFESLHDEFISGIQADLPPENERPSVLLTFESSDEPEAFSPYRLDDEGTSKKQWRDLGVPDALAGTDIENISTTERNKLDYEGLLDVDPGVLLIRGHERKSTAEFRETVVASMEDHSVGSELQAVQNGRVYRGGPIKQGPIQNLFLTERAAQQIFPDTFGTATGDQQLFDRQRVADIINGEF